MSIRRACEIDATTGRAYSVEYLYGDKLARVRGRVALKLCDLPPEIAQLTQLRSDGRFRHVYERKLRTVSIDSSPLWYQPMFKEGNVWFSKLGSYWDPAVASVAAELAKQRHKAGLPRQQIEAVEDDIIRAARDFTSEPSER